MTEKSYFNSAKKILVVEDEVVIAMDLCNQLEGLGYIVVATAVSGAQAIMQAAETKPDIILMDIVIKGDMDGITAAQTIIKSLNIPVIFLTAYSDPVTINRAKASGATSYLNKPFRPDELHACIEIALYKHQLEQKLRDSEQWFAKTLHCIGDAVVATDPQGKIRFMNPVAESLISRSIKQAKGRDIWDMMTLVSQETKQPIDNPIQQVLKTLSVRTFDQPTSMITRAGKEIPIDDSAAPVIGNDNVLLGAVLVMRDITERQIMENLLKESEARFHSAFAQAAIGMTLIAVDGRLLQVNNSLIDIFGYSEAELLNSTLQNLVYEKEYRAILTSHLQELSSGKISSFHVELLCNHKIPSKHLWILLSGSIVQNDLGEPQYFIIQVQNISERKSMEQQLFYVANHDPLTGLLNRQQFNNRLTETLTLTRRHQNKLALMYLDLDRFKLINDTLGHRTGDLLLQAVGERLKKSVRSNDVLARLGGDEFIILLIDIEDINDAARIAQKTIDLLMQPFLIEANEVIITCSIGISIFPNDGDNGQLLMTNADTAMYLAKERGKNNYQFYTEDMTRRSIERLFIESGLRRALTNHELRVHYQPQVDLLKGRAISAEALVRWEHPEWGLIHPDRFIKIAEETGLIVSLGQWVLETACRQAKSWRDNDGPVCHITVNVSARQFMEADLFKNIQSTLLETELEPSLLELEITESAMMQDPKWTLNVLQQLNELGVKLSIDDFGTGYSSLNYLRKFPVHHVKIDRSFVQDIPYDKGTMAMVRAIIALAHELNLYVTAEGVETPEQLAFLKKHQCDQVQGYLLCRPVPEGNLDKIFLLPENQYANNKNWPLQ